MRKSELRREGGHEEGGREGEGMAGGREGGKQVRKGREGGTSSSCSPLHFVTATRVMLRITPFISAQIFRASQKRSYACNRANAVHDADSHRIRANADRNGGERSVQVREGKSARSLFMVVTCRSVR